MDEGGRSSLAETWELLDERVPTHCAGLVLPCTAPIPSLSLASTHCTGVVCPPSIPPSVSPPRVTSPSHCAGVVLLCTVASAVAAGPVPTLLEGVTVKVYLTPSVRPVI